MSFGIRWDSADSTEQRRGGSAFDTFFKNEKVRKKSSGAKESAGQDAEERKTDRSKDRNPARRGQADEGMTHRSEKARAGGGERGESGDRSDSKGRGRGKDPAGKPDAPVTPGGERVAPPSAEGSYRLGENSFGGNFLNFDGNGSASIIGPNGTNLNFSSIRTDASGAIFGEGGAGTINGRTVEGGTGFKLSIAPNDAGYLLELKADGEKFESQAIANGIVPPGVCGGGIDSDAPGRGGGLLFIYALGDNEIGAAQATLFTDGTATLTGPDVDIAFTDGGYDDAGNWVAKAGSGTIGGREVTLHANADGNVFEAIGEGGLASSVEAWIDGTELNAEVVAVAQP